ncbi:MAG: DivIVA domain-containing protein [Deltaproteobacteria bacterium]|nr:DivIVA domain-containing protein [Deltaproteobacteria bacterium]
MKLTPLDLQQKTFRKVRLGGVDEREVDLFLDLAASELEDVVRKLHQQEEEVRRQNARLAEHREREQLLQQTLTTAQRLADEMKVTTRKEADIILSDAELQAEKIIANAQARRMQLIVEIDELKRNRTMFMSQLASLIDTHKAMLDAIRGAEGQEGQKAPVVGENVSFLSPPASKRG